MATYTGCDADGCDQLAVMLFTDLDKGEAFARCGLDMQIFMGEILVGFGWSVAPPEPTGEDDAEAPAVADAEPPQVDVGRPDAPPTPEAEPEPDGAATPRGTAAPEQPAGAALASGTTAVPGTQ